MGTVDRSVWYQARYSTFDTRRTPQTAYLSKAMKIVRTRIGVSRVNWKQAIKNHTNAGTNLSGTFETIDGSSSISYGKAVYDVNIPGPDKTRWYKVAGDINVHRYIGFITGVGYVMTFTGPDIMGNTAEQLATMQAYKQIRGATRSFEGGVFLGELRETLRMLRRPAAGLVDGLSSYLHRLADKERAAKAAKRYRKGEKRKAEKRSERDAEDRIKKSAAQAWLEGSFGWLPFVSDIESALKAYERLATQNNEDRFTKIRAFGVSDAHVNSSSEKYSLISNLRVESTIHETQRAVFIIRGEVRSRPEMARVDTQKELGLTLRDFVPTAWNLLPWSFLFDYFADVGGFLDASTTDTSGVTWMCGTGIKERKKLINSCANASDQPDAATMLDFYSNRAVTTMKRRTVGRNGTYQLAVPTVLFRLPTAPLKQLNMVALFAQANSIHPQRFRMR